MLKRWALLVIPILVIAGCARKEARVEEEIIVITPEDTTEIAVDTSAVSKDTLVIVEEEERIPLEFPRIYFDFDKYDIRTGDTKILEKNAGLLKDNPKVKIRIEGHCDERGTTEYNLALGEKRAKAARDYLVRLGIEKSRISIISYGEEKPFDTGHSESAWARNRRAEFVVIK